MFTIQKMRFFCLSDLDRSNGGVLVLDNSSTIEGGNYDRELVTKALILVVKSSLGLGNFTEILETWAKSGVALLSQETRTYVGSILTRKENGEIISTSYNPIVVDSALARDGIFNDLLKYLPEGTMIHKK